ncbi:MAG: hypothetical protein IT457_07985 [Planctomycetes bacterium]|nr:hypothetical protein [Planctomycetota bacterium]
MGKHRLAVAAGLAAVLSGCGDPLVGRSFADEDALLTAAGDFVVVGRFDAEFPATVTRLQEAFDGIAFRHRGQPHDYARWDGWVMRVLHVECRGKTGVFVLRSKEKRASPDPIATPPR